MLLFSNTGGVAGTNAFLLADEDSRRAVIFDAPDHTLAPLLGEAEKQQLEVIGLWLTHGHFDHFADHALVKRRFPRASVLVHAADAPMTRHPDLQTRLFSLPFRIEPLQPDGLLSDNQQLAIGKLKVIVLHTPGHSPGHVVYHFPDEQVLVGGDLIIGGSVGRTDLPESNPSDLETSVARVMQLPGDTRLLPGHGEPSTLADELRTNPWVRAALRKK
jgi:hydroxyacylglutathione hydrolase